jgi:ABC-type Na+ efflux pump permease subunit
MKGLKTIICKEWKCFIGSDRGVFILYAVLVLSWSFFLIGGSDSSRAGPLWLVFFSVVVAANFSNTVFISERISGALEILITSGLSRNSILFGKMSFVMGMSLVIGGGCMGLACFWQHLMYDYEITTLRTLDFVTYAASAFLNTAGSAFLSVRMPNPRLLHLANLLLTGCVVVAYTVLSLYYPVPDFFLPLFLVLIGLVSSILAKNEFNSERVLQPVIF